MDFKGIKLHCDYPTDIHVGRPLAHAIFNELRKSEAFKNEFDAIKSEIEAARKAPQRAREKAAG